MFNYSEELLRSLEETGRIMAAALAYALEEESDRDRRAKEIAELEELWRFQE